jgi:hypothetical protein
VNQVEISSVICVAKRLMKLAGENDYSITYLTVDSELLANGLVCVFLWPVEQRMKLSGGK